MSHEFEVFDDGRFLQAAPVRHGFQVGIGISDDDFEPRVIFQFSFDFSDGSERPLHGLSFTIEQATCLRDMLNFALDPDSHPVEKTEPVPDAVEPSEPETIVLRCERIADLPEPVGEVERGFCEQCCAEVWFPIPLQTELAERYPAKSVAYLCSACVPRTQLRERPVMTRGQVALLRANGVDDEEIAHLLAMISTLGSNADIGDLDGFLDRFEHEPDLEHRFLAELVWAQSVVASGGE